MKNNHPGHYRLGLDVGTNSLGWSVIETDERGKPLNITTAGSRIFSDGRDPKSKATLAATRREARSARRRRDRYIQRRTYLLDALTTAGLFPGDEDTRRALQVLNPLELRARLLTETAQNILTDLKTRTKTGQDKEAQPDAANKVLNTVDVKPEYLIGRALFHLNQRRGFQSNRKDKSEETTSGKVSGSVRNLLQDMALIDEPLSREDYKELSKEEKKQARQDEAQARVEALNKLQRQNDLTFGRFLYERYQQNKPTRARPGAGDDGKLYDVYPNREMYQDEFSKIWTVQAQHHRTLMTDALKETIHKVIFTQHPLKPQERGQCSYINNEKRTFRAMPGFQRYRMYQEVNSLEWATAEGRHCLREYPEARDAIIELLERPTTKNGLVVWGNMKTCLKKYEIVEGDIVFNFETPKRKGFDGNLTSSVMQHEDCIGPEWYQWPLEKQDGFIEIILDDELDDGTVMKRLMSQYQLDEHIARNCMNARLVDGTANVSLKAARLMLEKMRDGIEQIDPVTGEIRTILLMQSDAASEVAKEVADFQDPMRRKKTDEGKFEPDEYLRYYGEVFQDGSHIIPGSRKEKDRHNDLKYWGGITNPTVHIALNQIRLVVNELIDRFGHPASIAIELGRELPTGAEGRREIEKEQKERQDKNEGWKKTLREEGQEINRDNILRLELWEEQDKRCPFTGKKIGIADLFSDQFEIEHLIPFSISLDDSKANKVICTRQANRDKGQHTPFQAFGDSPSGYHWNDIFERYQNLPRSKQWRFQENALKIWEGDSAEIEKAARKMIDNTNETIASIGKQIASIGKQIMDKGVASLSDKQKKIAEEHGIPHPEFSPRHLNDTRYIGRLTREYLECICHIDKIDVLTGRLTSLLRGHWGLNSILQTPRDEAGHYDDANQPGEPQQNKAKKKNRDDHRHHAVDAIVIGMTSKSILQKVATAANQAEKLKLERIFPKTENHKSAIDPWDGFRNDVKATVCDIIVSHKVKRKKLDGRTTTCQLHNETAFGLIQPVNEDKNEWKTVVRRPIDYLKEQKQVKNIRDEELRDRFLGAFDDAVADGKKGLEGIQTLAREKGIRHLRCFGPKQAIPIRDKNKAIYKGYQGNSNWGIEIYAFPEGHKKADEWQGVVISNFEANQPGFQPGTTFRPEPTARLIMRLQIDECIEIEENDTKRLMRLQKTDQAKQSAFFAPLNEANVDKRNRSKEDDFKYFQRSADDLRSLNARKVRISATGQVSYEKRHKSRHRKK